MPACGLSALQDSCLLLVDPITCAIPWDPRYVARRVCRSAGSAVPEPASPELLHPCAFTLTAPACACVHNIAACLDRVFVIVRWSRRQAPTGCDGSRGHYVVRGDSVVRGAQQVADWLRDFKDGKFADLADTFDKVNGIALYNYRKGDLKVCGGARGITLYNLHPHGELLRLLLRI